MITLKGKSVCGGIAFGKIYTFVRSGSTVKRVRIDNSDDEIERFRAAKVSAGYELEALYNKAINEVGEENAMIFQIHKMMLDDLDYCESIESIISLQMLNAETAVARTCDNFVSMFEAMEDSYMQARSADVKDVSERIIRILSGNSGGSVFLDEPSIIAADDLAPSETVQMDKTKILAFVTEGGSSSSHTSILARMMNIPAIIGVTGLTEQNYMGKEAIVDGFAGCIYIEPDSDTIAKMRNALDTENKRKLFLSQLRGRKSITKDGQKIELYANIANALDTGLALSNDAEGIGLFRSEFLYLEASDYPTEDMQFGVYKDVLSKMINKKVVIRTLDIGADKQVGYFNMPDEENPALGVRAIRICLTRPQIFKTQLRALYRASIYGRLAIMFPMIASEWEVLKILEITEEVKKELKEEGIEYSDSVELGCMIETPAAAIISDVLANHLDFFSIGTNDLTQYTLAVDRQNPNTELFCDERHPAILRLIKLVCDNAHDKGLWVGICGELGADLQLTETFLAMGVDELSVTPSAVLPIRMKVIETNVSEIRDGILNNL